MVVVARPTVVLERSVELGFSQRQKQGDENTGPPKTHLQVSTQAPLQFEEVPKETRIPVLSWRFNIRCARFWNKAAEFHLVCRCCGCGGLCGSDNGPL